jgi:hypothetical protein
MVVEVLAAGLIGIIGTLLGAFFQYYFGQRKEESTRRIEDWNTVVREVYSPLIFDLRSIKDWGTLRHLRVLGKTISQLVKKQSKEQLGNTLTFLLKITKGRQSQILKDTLRKNARFIRPKNLWDDLFEFHNSLEFLENNLEMLSTGLFKGSSKFIAHLEAYIQIGAILDKATEHLADAMEQLTLLDKPPTSLRYKTFFTEEVRRSLVSELDKAPDFIPED